MWMPTRSALGSLSFWMSRAHTETDTGNYDLFGSPFLFMENQIWLVNGRIILAIPCEGEQPSTVNSHLPSQDHLRYQLFPTVQHSSAHPGKMKAKNRDQSLSDSRELDGSYDQLTGEWTSVYSTDGRCVISCWKKIQYVKLIIYKERVLTNFWWLDMSQPVRHSSHHLTEKRSIQWFYGYPLYIYAVQVYLLYVLPW